MICRPFIRSTLVAVSVAASIACTPSADSLLSPKDLPVLEEPLLHDVNEVLDTQSQSLRSLRALLKIRARKSSFERELSAAFVFSEPARARLSLFATQFNRLLSLLLVEDERLSVLLPDERVLIEAEASAANMNAVLGVPLEASEFAFWLAGALPPGPRAIYWDAEERAYLSEQRLKDGRLLRAKIRANTDGPLRVREIELLDGPEGVTVLHSKTLWAEDAKPKQHIVALKESGVSLTISLERLEQGSSPIEPSEAARVFALPRPPGVRTVPLSEAQSQGLLLIQE